MFKVALQASRAGLHYTMGSITLLLNSSSQKIILSNIHSSNIYFTKSPKLTYTLSQILFSILNLDSIFSSMFLQWSSMMDL